MHPRTLQGVTVYERTHLRAPLQSEPYIFLITGNDIRALRSADTCLHKSLQGQCKARVWRHSVLCP